MRILLFFTSSRYDSLNAFSQALMDSYLAMGHECERIDVESTSGPAIAAAIERNPDLIITTNGTGCDWMFNNYFRTKTPCPVVNWFLDHPVHHVERLNYCSITPGTIQCFHDRANVDYYHDTFASENGRFLPLFGYAAEHVEKDIDLLMLGTIAIPNAPSKESQADHEHRVTERIALLNALADRGVVVDHWGLIDKTCAKRLPTSHRYHGPVEPFAEGVKLISRAKKLINVGHGIVDGPHDREMTAKLCGTEIVGHTWEHTASIGITAMDRAKDILGLAER